MYTSNDTIVARATPAGFGAISIVRLSGEETVDIIAQNTELDNQLEHKHIYQTKFLNDLDNTLDQVIISFYRGPKSYTGEDVAEINCHGNPNLVQKIIDICIDSGAKLAEPGEFTKRRFFNNKIDLTQAEGVNQFIHSETEASQTASRKLLQGQVGEKIHKIKDNIIENISLLEAELDFSEQEIESTPLTEIKTNINSIISSINSLIKTYKYGQLIKAGLQISITGPPNCGKSTLLNSLLQEERAITSTQPGTTRDFIEESIEHKGYKLNFIDTAGLREPSTSLEKDGINKALKIIDSSDIVLLLIDPTQSVQKHSNFDFNTKNKIFKVINKIDIVNENKVEHYKNEFNIDDPIKISAKQHTNLGEMCDRIVSWIETQKSAQTDNIITVQRHYNALKIVKNELKSAQETIESGFTSEFVVADLRTALDSLDTILGKTTNEEILENIFNNFCIGK